MSSSGKDGRPKELSSCQAMRSYVAAVLHHRHDLRGERAADGVRGGRATRPAPGFGGPGFVCRPGGVRPRRGEHNGRGAHGDAVEHDLCLRVLCGDFLRPEVDVTALVVAEGDEAAVAHACAAQVRRHDVIAHVQVVAGEVPGVLLRAAVAVHDDGPAMAPAARGEMRPREGCAIRRFDVPGLGGEVRLRVARDARRHDERVGAWRCLMVVGRAALQAELHDVAAEKVARAEQEQRRHQDGRDEERDEDFLHILLPQKTMTHPLDMCII